MIQDDGTAQSDVTLPPSLVARVERSRQDIINSLKATEDFAKQIRAWRNGDLYAASGPREVILNLKPNPDGSVMGWAQGSDGKFIGQARWTRATIWGSRVVSSSAVLAGHVMLVEISYKLDRIEDKVDRIVQALADDRRQALKAAIDSVETALQCEPSTGRDLLIAAATPLRTAIRQEIQALARRIETTPMPPRSHAKGFIWDTGPDTRKALAEAEKSFLAALEGIRSLTHLYVGLGEDRTASMTAHELLAQISEANLRDAWWKGRNLRPQNREDQPEAFWTRAVAVIEEARSHSLVYNDNVSSNLVLSLSNAELEFIVADADTPKEQSRSIQQ